MTCIVGIEHDGDVWMAGDSAGVSGWTVTQRADEKVFERGPFVFGFTTSFRMGQLLRYRLDVPVQKELGSKLDDDHAFLATTFVDAVRKCLKDGGFATTKDEGEVGGTFLVGYRGRLYEVGNDYQVGRSIHGFDAVGCGDHLALGALDATRDLDMEPMRRIGLALEAAARFSTGVAPPFHVVRHINKRGARRAS